jgi:hypothetical protein
VVRRIGCVKPLLERLGKRLQIRHGRVLLVDLLAVRAEAVHRGRVALHIG